LRRDLVAEPELMKLGLRYDMRAPALGAPATALYAAAIEQSAWADHLGFDYVHLAEHHGAEDNYCPSPLILGAAIASRTKTIELHFSALVVTMHDPIRLAEDLAVLDLITGGNRISITAGIGYRPLEFDMFGVDFERRAERFEEILRVLHEAWSGKAFSYRDTIVQVTPPPVTPGGPPIFLGGSAIRSAKRAARLGYGYRPTSEVLYEAYERECQKVGGLAPEPFSRQGPAFLYLTDDPERDWPIVAPHVLHASNLYAQWARERPNATDNGTWQELSSIEDLKADPNLWVITPEECLARTQELRSDDELRFHPLLGGLAPELSWRSLELFASDVLPHIEASDSLRQTSR
jgi:alkanesulfonate monooxygenase SsuD/methylene tetrahydromethanopterin reductase-like flavin-dependent oxidoreductase (luciferase family)